MDAGANAEIGKVSRQGQPSAACTRLVCRCVLFKTRQLSQSEQLALPAPTQVQHICTSSQQPNPPLFLHAMHYKLHGPASGATAHLPHACVVHDVTHGHGPTIRPMTWGWSRASLCPHWHQVPSPHLNWHSWQASSDLSRCLCAARQQPQTQQTQLPEPQRQH